MPNDATRATAETLLITLPATTIYPGDQMDRAMDKLRTVHLAMAPDNKGWHDDSTLMSVWATLEQVIRDLEPVRNRLQGVEGNAASPPPTKGNLREELWSVVVDIEGDMRRVYDHALIVHDKLIERQRISTEMQHALSWSAADLLSTGERLREHFDALHALTRKGGAA